MLSDEHVLKLLREFTKAPDMILPAEVLDISEADKGVVTVRPLSQAELDDVRLRASVDGKDSGLVLVPKKGSDVLVGIIGNDVDTAFVAQCSELERLSVRIGEHSMVMDAEGLVFNGGELGGLLVAEKMRGQLEKLAARVDKIYDSFKQLKPDAAGAGSVALTGQLVKIIAVDKENWSDLQDEKIKH